MLKDVEISVKIMASACGVVLRAGKEWQTFTLEGKKTGSCDVTLNPPICVGEETVFMLICINDRHFVHII